MRSVKGVLYGAYTLNHSFDIFTREYHNQNNKKDKIERTGENMVIHFTDGSHAECSNFEIIDRVIYWDDYRYCDASEVEEITDD